MKLLLSLLFLFSTLFLSAQTADKSLDKQIETSIKLYDMDANQANQFKQLMLNKKADMNRLEKSNINYQEKLTEIQNKYDDSVFSILDDRQKKIFAIQKSMQDSGPVSGRDLGKKLID